MGGGIYAHTKMVEAYQKESEVYRRQIEKYYKKRAIDEPSPEQSITVRRGPKLKSDDEGTEKQVKARLKERERQASLKELKELKLSVPPPMGAAKGPKSPLLRRVKDL